VWESLVGVIGEHGRTRSGRAADLRAVAETALKRLRRDVAWDAQLLAAVATWLRTSVRAPLEREQAIARAIQEHHARLASQLLQHSLFDRRVEREAAAQRELLEQALSRCHTRTEELHRRRAAATITTRPAFSLITW
jgi:hypothetical protein